MRTRIELTALFLILLFIGITVQSHQVNATEPTLLKVVNPLSGDEWFNFSSNNMHVGDTFIANITVSNVSTLQSWQIGLTWNASLLEYINVILPSDNVFAFAPELQTIPS